MKYSLLLITTCLMLAGCAKYDKSCELHLQLGREYVAQGRYELAKEHYLMSLAASPNSGKHTLISRELASVDMMIKAQR